MKATVVGLCLSIAIAIAPGSSASQAPAPPPKEAATPAASGTSEEQELLSLSRQKWLWMSERNVDALAALFHEKAVFVHMGGTMTRDQELGFIKGGGIHYKHAEILEAWVRFVDTTAIVLTRIRLDAVVGGNEVTNPFMVTEVYVLGGRCSQARRAAFTRLLTP